MVLRAVCRLATTEAMTRAMISCSGTTITASNMVLRTDGQNRKFRSMVWKFPAP